MSDSVDIDLANFRNSINDLYKAVESIARREPPAPKIAGRSISGDHITGGKITQFESTGIKDESTKRVILVNDKGLHTDNINVKNMLGDTNVTGSLYVRGEITASKLHVNELTADVRNERTTPLEFLADDTGIYDKGLMWKGQGTTKQFVYRPAPDRLWSSESIDLNHEQTYSIGNTVVLSRTELGNSVTHSNLTKVGTLNNLRTQGDLVIDEYLHYESASQRVGFGTESPNGTVGIASLDSEFIIDVDGINTRIGNWTTSNLDIVTDDTPRISISATGNIVIGTNNETKTTVQGRLGINVKNPDCDISTAGPVKFEGKKFSVGERAPNNGSWIKGDVVWNTDPKPTGYVGWICVRDGTPGEWKPFGQISA